jgi:mannose-P-dolichol utilization defect 1
LSAYVLETLAYAITLAYSFRNNFPFSTYGENFFLTLQNIVITMLIIRYPSSRLTRAPNTTPQLALATALTVVSGVALYVAPISTLAALQMATIPLSLFSKIPQIRQNARARSTGQLSAFAVISQIAGCLARLFTTAAEVGDLILTAGFALALLLNVVLGIQMWTYWGKDGIKETSIPLEVRTRQEDDEHIPAAAWQQDGKVSIVVQPASPTVSSPARSQAGRKWARKVD